MGVPRSPRASLRGGSNLTAPKLAFILDTNSLHPTAA